MRASYDRAERAWPAMRRIRVAVVCAALAGCSSDALPVPGAATLTTTRIRVLAETTTAGFELKDVIGQWAATSIERGQVALLDRKGNRVVLIDTTGRVVRTFGRSGRWPGEIANARYLARIDSGLAVFDGLKASFVRFDLRGRSLAELSQVPAIGIPKGWLTGMAVLADGRWVYSAAEIVDGLYYEGLYLHTDGVARLLASTPGSPVRTLRFACRARFTNGAAVFSPTLRWAATGTHVAYATTETDRVVVWNVADGDSIVITGNAIARRATREAALAATDSFTLQTLSQRCTMSREEIVEQRGMMKVMPPIAAVALAPDGTLWVRLTTLPDEPSFIRVHGPATTDTIVGGAFPGLFLSPTRFIAEEADSAAGATTTLWEVRQRLVPSGQ